MGRDGGGSGSGGGSGGSGGGGGGKSWTGPGERPAAGPFPALRHLTVGVPSEQDHLAAAAALTRLESLSARHLRVGARRFSPAAPWALAAVTSLTRLSLLPVEGGGAETVHHPPGCRSHAPDPPEFPGPEALWPRLAAYVGPRVRASPAGDAARRVDRGQGARAV
ncbi:MAG: hypothetical protein J3K34DRAFT_420360 [Monoraphidium minutum]|nr:MAG: hypothetical protein J3K34DRAFT_420360 [Monoraphidium minutum]